MNYREEYVRITNAEHEGITAVPYDEMARLAVQLLEVAKSSTVLRIYNTQYGATDDQVAYESVGAHTNLMMAILDRALYLKYGSFIDSSLVGMHSYRSVMEAARWHDLPENQTGDIPDNGNRDETFKHLVEQEYYAFLAQNMPTSFEWMTPSVLSLLKEMQECSTKLGRMLYLADKVSALVITLCYDLMGLTAKMARDSPIAVKRDLFEMEICNRPEDRDFRASEMWAVDYLKARNLKQYDETGFFTDLLVMMTLLVRGSWYEWREQDYIH